MSDVLRIPGSFKTADYKLLLSAPFEYAFHEVFNDDFQRAWSGMLNIFHLCLTMCCDDDDDQTCMRELKSVVVDKVSLFEKVFPVTEHARIVHLFVHVPDVIYRWNHVRNFWAFFPERYDLHHCSSFNLLVLLLLLLIVKRVVLLFVD